MPFPEKRHNWITLMLCIGVIQICIYYVLGASVRPDGGFAYGQPDTALYLQAARRIADGAPFTYSPGALPSSGTTSILYPFLLAVFPALGVSGGSLCLAGFLLNALFYLGFLVCWGVVIGTVAERPWPRLLTGAVLALSGQFALVASMQSDVGLWLFVSALLAVGLARERRGWCLAVLALAPWVRPEGIFCVVAYIAVALFRWLRGRKAAEGPGRLLQAGGPWLLLPVLSVAGVFALNIWLAGSPQFTSLQGKGYLNTLPFFPALCASARDLMTIFRQLFVWGPSGCPREFLILPGLGAVLLWWHVFTRDYGRFRWGEGVYLLASALGVLSVATSGMQGYNGDRYLAWILPPAVIYMSLGAVSLGDRLKGVARRLPCAFLLCFTGGAAVVQVGGFRMGCESTEVDRAFYERCEAAMEPGASLGALSNSGAVFSLSPRKFVHLYGIYSPEFKLRDVVSSLEKLKRDAGSRFRYWLYCQSAEGALLPGESAKGLWGRTVLAGPNGLELHEADWTPFERAGRIPPPPAEGVSCRDSVDVGYGPDEERADYVPLGDYGRRPPAPELRYDRLGGQWIVDAGRVLWGGDEMTVAGLRPGADLHVVMRTVSRQKVSVQDGLAARSEVYALAPTIGLQVLVDGREAGVVRVEMPQEGFGDVAFVIPGGAIAQSSCRISLLGGHVSFGYWFYQ